MTVVSFCASEKRAYCALVFSFFNGGHSRGAGFDGHILSSVEARALAQLQTFYLRPRVDGIPCSKSSDAPIGACTSLASRRDVHLAIGACSSPPGELSPISVFESGYDEGPLRLRSRSGSLYPEPVKAGYKFICGSVLILIARVCAIRGAPLG
jgi:hypothetical protein